MTRRLAEGPRAGGVQSFTSASPGRAISFSLDKLASRSYPRRQSCSSRSPSRRGSSHAATAGFLSRRSGCQPHCTVTGPQGGVEVLSILAALGMGWSDWQAVKDKTHTNAIRVCAMISCAPPSSGIFPASHLGSQSLRRDRETDARRPSEPIFIADLQSDAVGFPILPIVLRHSRNRVVVIEIV